MTLRTQQVTVNSETPTRLDFDEDYFDSHGAPKISGSYIIVEVGLFDIYISGSADDFDVDATGVDAPRRWAAGSIKGRLIYRREGDVVYAKTKTSTSLCQVEQWNL